jgi:hypothetical protein
VLRVICHAAINVIGLLKYGNNLELKGHIGNVVKTWDLSKSEYTVAS